MNEFNIEAKNQQYKMVRECYGARVGQDEREIKVKEMEKVLKEQSKAGDSLQNNLKWLKISSLNFEARQEPRLEKILQAKQLKDI